MSTIRKIIGLLKNCKIANIYVYGEYALKKSRDIDVNDVKQLQIVVDKVNQVGSVQNYLTIRLSDYDSLEYGPICSLDYLGLKITITNIEHILNDHKVDFNCELLCIPVNNTNNYVVSEDVLSNLNTETLRTIQDPFQYFRKKPEIILKAASYSAMLGFKIDPETLLAMKYCRNRLYMNVHKSIIRDELLHILGSDHPEYGIETLRTSGVLENIIPELTNLDEDGDTYRKHKNNYVHSLLVLKSVAEKTKDIDIRLAALLHDIGKTQVKKWNDQKGWTFYGHDKVGKSMSIRIFKRLGINSPKAILLIGLHMRPSLMCLENNLTDSAIRRLVTDSRGYIEDLMLLASSDITTASSEKRNILNHGFSILKQKIEELLEKDMVRNYKPSIQGKEIMEYYGIKPCNLIGEIKDEMKELILEGTLEDSKEEIYKWLDHERSRFLG